MNARRVAFVASAVGLLAGCTFLIDFDEVPSTELSDAAGPDAPDVILVDAKTDALDAGVDARDANPGFETACKGKIDGRYCPGDTIVWPGNRDELITCAGGKVANVRLCDKGGGCIPMTPGYPDECDECAGKADGTYCGRDMPGWAAKNANQRVRCANKAQVGLLLCSTTCKSNGGSSICQ